MQIKFFTIALMLILFGILPSCTTFNIGNKIDEALDVGSLNKTFDAKPIDLSRNSKCTDIIEFKVINKETRSDEYTLTEDAPNNFFIVPKDFTYSVAKYILLKLDESKINVNSYSGKEIHLYFERAEGVYIEYKWKSIVSLRVEIPEIEFAKTYEWNETDNFLEEAIAKSVYQIVYTFLNDPIVIKYLQCQ